MIEQSPEDGEEEYFRLSESGVENAIKAYEMFLEGATHVEVSDALGLSKEDDSDEEKTQFVQILIAMANISGILDKWEEFKEMDSKLEDIAQEFE